VKSFCDLTDFSFSFELGSMKRHEKISPCPNTTGVHGALVYKKPLNATKKLKKTEEIERKI